MQFQEFPQADGTIEVQMDGRPLTCTVCGGAHFHERSSLLNTRAAAFFNVNWANKEATNYICTQCGYVFWFML
ncbi:MAG: DNA-binding protein [Bryobacteraceae bacterium]|jgi:predicted nucleic-acid-binding Zn-ribbon protein